MCNENSRNSSRFITTFTNCVSGDLLQLTWQSGGLQCEWYRDQIPLETLHISEIKYAVLLYTLYVITSQNRKAHLKNILVIFDTKINVHISIIFICQLASMQSFEELLFKMQDQEETCMQFFFFFFFFNASFNNISVISWRSVFIGGGNQSTPTKPPICRKLLTNFIT